MLKRLHVRNFRNLAAVLWEPAAGSHLLLGDNGAGKSSLLEALYVVATTRSFRAGQLVDCRRHGAERFHLEAELDDAEVGRRSLELHLGPEGSRRLLNGAASALADHLGAQPIVAWTAADVEALIGPPRLRRRLLDRGVLGLRPAALAELARFRQALAQKRSLLLAGGRELATWNAVFAAAAVPVVALRQAYFVALEAQFARLVADLSLALPEVKLAYRPSPARALEGATAVEEALAVAAESERARQQPLVGPHRDDLEIRFGGKEIRRVASAGERKAVGLLLAAAHGRVLADAGKHPIYLLDDVDAELSPRSFAALWPLLAGAPQVFASSNRPRVWEGRELTARWDLVAGSLSSNEAS